MALIMDSRTGELLAVAQLTMPTPSEPLTMRQSPALPVWFIPPGSTSTKPGPPAWRHRQRDERGQRSTGGSALCLCVHNSL